jgi:Ca2+-binding RTX toxin-like protein
MILASGVAWAVTKNCRASADHCVGTNSRDTLYGSKWKDKISGLEENDRLWGNGGNDLLKGGPGHDKLTGGPGEDYIDSGTQGADDIYGGPASDQIDDYSYHRENNRNISDKNLLNGGSGDDWLYGHNRLRGGPGDDYAIGSYAWGHPGRTISGGRGRDNISSNGTADDTIYAADGARDTITCGGGYDTVYFDRGIDSINRSNCEKRIGR